jgi:ubiquinone/menaquinone biosynthesis C-methylase UbiE
MAITELEYTECAFCGGNNNELLLEVCNTHGSYKISDDKFKLLKCRDCGLVYINPRPAMKEISKYYDSNYYSSKDIIRVFAERLFLHFFVNIKKGMVLKFKKAGNILDIGCGDGGFLSVFSLDKNWKAYGVEPNPSGYALSREKLGEAVFNKELSDCNFPDAYFDVITMWHVLEHIYEPNSLLSEINRVLDNRGVFIVGIPNINGMGFKLAKENWFHLDAPRHLYHYDPRTVTKILIKNGFEVLKINFPFAEYPLDLFHSLLNSLEKNKFIRIAVILPLLILSSVSKLVCSFLKISETIIVFCRKGG